MPLHPQAAEAIRVAGDLPTGLEPPELRRRYEAQRSKMLPPPAKVAVARELLIPSEDGPVPARFYRAAKNGGACPLLVYFHGGGWVLGSLELYDTACRRLAAKSSCAVVSVGYRLAPETPFPGAVRDAYAATRWCVTNSASLGIDPTRVAVGGDSAGGNLAAVMAQMSRDSREFSIALQALIYPVTDLSRDYPSHQRNASGYMLTTAALHWFIDQYVPKVVDRLDARASPMLCADLSGLPRALVIAAEFDPLVDENAAYAQRLKSAGVPVRYEHFAGMVHPFFTLGGIIDDAARAEDLIAAEMRALSG